MYQVQFISSGKVAYTTTERAHAKYWIECNNYGPEKPIADPETGEIVSYEAGDCLGLFKIVLVKKARQ